MNTDEVIKLTEENVLNTYGRINLAFEEGSGVILRDLEGNEYLDFTSGLGVNALGYAHPAVKELIKKQADKVIHTSNLYHIKSQSVLARKICESCFGEKVFFCNSGTEAVEGALKIARKWGKKFDSPKTEFTAFENSFHGRTFGALSATMQEKYRKGFEPLFPGFSKGIFNNKSSLEKVITDNTAAVIVEPLQGEGGINFADEDFMKYVESVCKQKKALLIVDEVQCGMGRTGRLYAHEHYEITPDIMTLAKPLAGGLPIGAVVVGPKVWPEINPGNHASTFGGNQFVTGVACGVFDILSDPDFLKDVAEKGEYLDGKLRNIKEKYKEVKEVRGKGLLMGLLVDFPASEAVDYFMNEHILICSAGKNVIRFIPPLIVKKEDIDRVINTLDCFLEGRK
ncbi:MAG: acetylornithine/succinylornithine family transaminase [Bacteroidetes bacterium]|nr:acetylornithine/succinylornithine family transaminase [Bacteroidota bacterium]